MYIKMLEEQVIKLTEQKCDQNIEKVKTNDPPVKLLDSQSEQQIVLEQSLRQEKAGLSYKQ